MKSTIKESFIVQLARNLAISFESNYFHFGNSSTMTRAGIPRALARGLAARFSVNYTPRQENLTSFTETRNLVSVRRITESSVRYVLRQSVHVTAHGLRKRRFVNGLECPKRPCGDGSKESKRRVESHVYQIWYTWMVRRHCTISDTVATDYKRKPLLQHTKARVFFLSSSSSLGRGSFSDDKGFDMKPEICANLRL